MSTEEASLGLATTRELIAELAARAEVASTVGEMWPGYSTVGGYALEEQVKPAIEEPTETFSVIKAHDKQADDSGLFWVRILGGWMDDKHGRFRAWHLLDVVEVLRVGIGETEAPSRREQVKAAIEEAEALQRAMPGPNDAYQQGWDDSRGKLRKHCIQLASSAITSERKDAWRQAIEALDALS